MSSDPIRGKVIRFSFSDGPMAKKTFEHAFDKDGTVHFRIVGGGIGSSAGKRAAQEESKKAPDPKYEIAKIREDSGGCLVPRERRLYSDDRPRLQDEGACGILLQRERCLATAWHLRICRARRAKAELDSSRSAMTTRSGRAPASARLRGGGAIPPRWPGQARR